jgi:cytochrome c-type biogenesis protein CcmF
MDLGWPQAAPWSLFVGNLGRWLILAGIATFLGATIASAMSRNRPNLQKWATGGFLVGVALLVGTLLALGALFVGDQFQYEYVRGRADAGTALKYKIAGIWAGQQGSFLLWACASALFGIFALRSMGPYRRTFLGVYSGFLALVCAILAYETPFKVTATHGQILVPPNGVGLTPSLQNYWVVVHPPVIFLGFGALTVMFALGVAAMVQNRSGDWADRMRPWSLVALALTGLGLCMGGFWAYETLGWGGFWAWDPVENVSLVPWLLTAALVHGLFVQKAGKGMRPSNLLLAGLPYLSFVYGTFLTRSGFLSETSVHSFAEMDRNALWILLALSCAAFVGYLMLWFVRGRTSGSIDSPEDAGPGIHRAGMYRLGSLLLSMLALAVAIGMSIPFFMAVFKQGAKVVEEPLYHQVVVWFFIPVMLLMAIAPFVGWRSLGTKALIGRVSNVLAISIGLLGIAMILLRNPKWGVRTEEAAKIDFPFGIQAPLLPWMLFLIFCCLLAAVSNLWQMFELRNRLKLSLGGFVSHFGIALLLAGLIISRGFERKEDQLVQEGTPTRLLDYVVEYQTHTSELVDRDNKVLFQVSGLHGGQFVARPGLYYFRGGDGEPKPMVWPHIQRQASHDIYFTLHPPVWELWEKPETFKPGERRTLKGATVTYEKFVMDGEPGQPGTGFGAQVRVEFDNGNVYNVTPMMRMGEGGIEPGLERIGSDLLVSMQGIDAGTQSAILQLHLSRPIYPVELFYKPMTILVWIGTGIMTIGILMSALSRRSRRSGGPRDPADEQGSSTDDVESEREDAPLPVA